MVGLSCAYVLVVLVANASHGFAMDEAITPDISQMKDAKSWSLLNAECRTAIEEGKNVVRLKPRSGTSTPSNIGLALVEGLEFGTGTLEIDLKGKGKWDRSFLGVAFSVADGRNFEAVYFRPFNFMKDSEVFRARAVQYVAWPEYTWEKLRSEKPGMFESAVRPIPDPSGWFHARVVVTKQKVSVWVDDAKEPCLVVDRLASRENGKIGLWVDSQEGSFSKLKIRPQK
jgi:hypothetical protein